MNQTPRTKTRSSKGATRPVRQLDVTRRPEDASTLASLVAPAEATLIWKEMATLASANPELLALVESARQLATVGQLADNSVMSYGSQWRTFVRWCDTVGLESMPASTATVLLYVAHRSGQGLTRATITSDVNAIRSYHLRAGFTNPTDHAVVSQARQSAARLAATGTSRKKKAHPLALSGVRDMVRCLPNLRFRSKDLAELNRIRMKAVLLSSWFTGRRLDEVARADLGWLRTRGDTLYLESDRQKMKDDGFSTPIERVADESICPLKALRDWLEASAPFRGEVQRLFARPMLDAEGRIVLVDKIPLNTQRKLDKGYSLDDPRFPTRAEFEASCRASGLATVTRELRYGLIRWMKLAGVEPESLDRSLGGHSMRRGLITELRSANVDPRVVADHVGLATMDMVERYSDAASTVRALDVLGL